MNRLIFYRKHFAFVLTLVLLLQSADFSVFAASPAEDGNYYVTYEGRFGFSDENVSNSNLFNPKTGATGSSTPYLIELGNEQAMCVTYGANATVSRDHHYVPNDLNSLKNNPYFQGGSDYPAENYLRGACYAYERLASLQGANGHTFTLPSGTYDADYQELIRRINTLGTDGATFLTYTGEELYYPILQIITWQIACGTFRPDDVASQAVAVDILGQLFPTSSGWDSYALPAIYIYDFFAICARECASGDYNEKFNGVSVTYWAVQGNDSANWQDFITWKVPDTIPNDIFVITKYGNIFPKNYKYSNATFNIYSDSGCTHQIGQFTTNNSGLAAISVVKGKYFLKEIAAPIGTILYTGIISLTVKRDTVSADVTNDEVKNYLEFNKYEYGTENLIPEEAKFDLYEYNTGTKDYLRVGAISYDGNGKYSLHAGDYTYHDETGAALTPIQADCLYYTPANQGKFKIVETEAPEGYRLSNGKEFTMNTDIDGYVHSFTSYETGIRELPYYCGVELFKFDALTADRLSGVVFMIQEKIGDQWYDVGELEESEDVYAASKNQTYSFHKADGTVYQTVKNSTAPLHKTSYNNGTYRIVETKPSNLFYVGSWSRAFKVAPTKDSTVISFTGFHDTAPENRGNGNALNLKKYDAVSKEAVPSGEAAFTIYEHIEALNEWLEVGNLNYNKETHTYSTEGILYRPHKADGTITSAAVGQTYLPGYIYYTAANKGRYKLVETKAPDKYELGAMQTGGTVSPYEKEFTITETDREVLNFTDITNGAKDIGISANVQLSKYDTITKQKVLSRDAMFTVYEQINGEWLEVGQMVYDTEQKIYTTKGMKAVFHNSKGESVYQEDSAYGLYYTTANAGNFKVTETKAPQDYITGSIPYSREFNITDVENGLLDLTAWENGAANLGVSGTVRVKKLDALTKQPVEWKDAVFTVYEQIDENWYEVGDLIYDKVTDSYTCDNAAFTFHDEEGNLLNTTDIPDFTSGKLYYTTANQGRFKVTETKAPKSYTLSRFEQTFAINDGNTEIEYLTEGKAAYNLGVSGTVKAAKYDAVTKEKVLTGDAEFTIYERINALNEWLPVGILVYEEETNEYVCDNAAFIFHDETGNLLDVADIPDFTSGKLYYTTADQGRFKVEETKAPKNYTLNEFNREFTITEAGTVYEFNTVETGAADTGISGAVKLVKADSFTEKPLTGATFIIQEWSETKRGWFDAGTLTDNGDGTYTVNHCTIHTGKDEETAEFENLIYTTQNRGRFRIKETKAPEGYLNEGWVSEELNLTEDMTEFIFENEQHMVKNVPIRVSVSKKSMTTGKDIEGAKLTITDSKGKVIDSWITDGSEHILSAIPAGTYTLTEEAAPEGYIITNSIEFEVTETAEIQKVEMFDEEVKGRLIINKVDSITGAALAGAVFELKDEQGNVIQTLITDENGHAESELLAFGIYDTNGRYLGSKKYTLTEITSPNGYRLDGTPITIEFEYQNGQTEVVEVNVTVRNEKEPEVPTGDKADFTALLILMLGAALAIGASVYCKKRNKRVI